MRDPLRLRRRIRCGNPARDLDFILADAALTPAAEVVDAGEDAAAVPYVSRMRRVLTSTLPKRPRRTQEERSGETRERLLRAAIEALNDRGFGGFTMSEVAGRAGVSNGALVHHYPSKGLLVIAATEYAYDLAIESGRRCAAEASARRDPLGAFLRDSTFIYFGEHFIIASEVLYGVRPDTVLMPRITAAMERYRATINQVWLSLFAEAGVPDELAALCCLFADARN